MVATTTFDVSTAFAVDEQADALSIQTEAALATSMDTMQGARELWEHVFDMQSGFLCIVTEDRSSTDSRFRETFYRWPEQGVHAAQFALHAASEGFDVYFNPTLYRREYQRDDVDVPQITLCVADMVLPETGLPPFLAPRPTAIVEVAPGRFDRYWKLTELQEQYELVSLYRRMAAALGAGILFAFCGAQSMRVPGTINHSQADIPQVNGRIFHDVPAYTVDSLSSSVPEASRSCDEDTDLVVLPSREVAQATPAVAAVDIPDDAVTETRIAEQLVRLSGNEIHYVPEIKTWMVWDGKRWVADAANTRIRRLAVETARAIQAVITIEVKDSEKRQRLMRAALRMEDAPKIRGVVQQAEAIEGVTTPYTAFDEQPWLINVYNGTFDLQSGTLRAHQRDDLITQIAPVTYDANAEAPEWQRFLQTIFDGDDDLIAYVQRVVGYALSADTSERAFFVAYGRGRNGKSVFLEALKGVFGDYAAATTPELLLKQRMTQHPADLAVLRAKRFVYAQEPEEGRRLNEAFIKSVTGGDTITARLMRENPFEFKPVFKVWMSTNSKPVIRESGTAIWDRVKLIPFTVTISTSQQRPRHELMSAFQRESAGILRWAVEGFAAYRKHGLTEPPAVLRAVSEYRGEMDTLGRFLDDCCDIKPGLKTPSSDLYRAYSSWCQVNGEERWTMQVFGRRLKERGLHDKRWRVDGTPEQVRGWLGVGLTHIPRAYFEER